MCQRVTVTCRGTSKVWRRGLPRFLGSSTRGSAKFSMKEQPHAIVYAVGHPAGKEEDLGVLVDTSLECEPAVVLAAEKENGILPCVRQSITRWVREVIIPLL